jgi:hypothetical protein
MTDSNIVSSTQMMGSIPLPPSPPIAFIKPITSKKAENIDLSHNLHRDTRGVLVRDEIIRRLSSFPDVNKYRYDIEFLLLGANLIENLVKKSDKIDKKELLLAVFTAIFNLEEAELQIIGKHIDFLVNHKRVKSVSHFKIFLRNIANLFRRK